MKTATRFMSQDLTTLTPDRLVYHAYLAMDEKRLRHLPIVDKEGNLVGIVSDRDLKKQIRDAFDPEVQSFDDVEFMLREVHDIMTKDPIFAYEDTDLLRITQLMLTHKISSVVILSQDSQKPKGIITDTDMLEVLADYLRGAP